MAVAFPADRESRRAHARAVDERVSFVLAHSESVLEHSLDHVAAARAWLDEIRLVLHIA